MRKFREYFRDKGVWQLATVMVAGAVLSLFCRTFVQQYEDDKLKVQFEKMAAANVALLKMNLHNQVREISALKRFFEGSLFVDMDEFRRFVKPLVTQGMQARAVGWVHQVTAGARATYNTQACVETAYAYPIVAFSSQGELVPAGEQERYYPFCYVEPMAKNRRMVGFDLGSDPLGRRALEAAEAFGETIVSGRLPVLPGEDAADGFLVVAPVYRGGVFMDPGARADLMGFAVGVYRFDDIMARALVASPPGGFDILIDDLDAPEGRAHLYRRNAVASAQDRKRHVPVRYAAMGYRECFALADCRWEISCLPTGRFFDVHAPWANGLVLASGLMLTVAMTGFLYMIQRRGDQVQRLVRLRTKALQESETRLHLALSGADLALWEWHVPTGEMLFSRKWADMTGCNLENLLPHVNTWRDLAHPADRKWVFERLDEHLAGSTAQFEAEYRLRHLSGDWIWVRVRGRVIERAKDGSPVRVSGTHLDITEAKRLNAIREMLVAAIAQAGESIVVADAGECVQYVNPAFERISGYTSAQIVGQPLSLLVGGSASGYPDDHIGGTIRKGRIWQGLVVSKKKNGVMFHESASIAPVFDGHGTITNYVMVKHDLSDQRRLEEEKQRLEEQYHQAQKLESVGRLAGGIAHDLNNLLGPILGYAEMLLDNVDEEEKCYLPLREIQTAGLRAREVVRQLLAFGRKQSLAMRPIDLNTVVEDFSALLRRMLRENISLSFRPDPAPQMVMADAGQLEQILMNLAVNSQDAMAGGGRLVFETMPVTFDAAYEDAHRRVAPGRYVMLAVSDSGTGIAPAHLEKVFEPFFTTKEVGKGTGLGLAMVYGTVKQHGGYIWAHSEANRGTCFKLFFPAIEAPCRQVGQETVPPVAVAAGGNETLLVVEDDPSIRRMIVKVLSQKGYRVFSAENGRACMELLVSRCPAVDLLLTDVIMPDIDGRTLYEQVEERIGHLKVIYMSGYTDEVIATHGVLSEGTHFIQKPFSIHAISDMVRRVLDAPWPAGSA